MGKISDNYPYLFSIYKWLDGRSANHVTLDEQSLENIASELANFLKELQAWALWKATFELCNITDKNSPEAFVQKRIIDDLI